ncbi:uncharacterized protein SEPMUDRAFT_125005 [Sphaerulina musiva SO2202]|uniref:Uncharacterized protein n=1 Tax=Sphaerulina musiva (strain SO2202) TaxID=692275 RepID=M3B028_SPHMS|nr:uncharacterized protein SEPMUDRAFT_125005 [Sphaerulina musiva SO2202]EMF13147.1 hypothetical protein SEPMUDRAFT_125005 [Sphaerulina musiva SO2202]
MFQDFTPDSVATAETPSTRVTARTRYIIIQQMMSARERALYKASRTSGEEV